MEFLALEWAWGSVVCQGHRNRIGETQRVWLIHGHLGVQHGRISATDAEQVLDQSLQQQKSAFFDVSMMAFVIDL